MQPKKPAPIALPARKTRRVAPAHLRPSRPAPLAPNGLEMSRELSSFTNEFRGEFQNLREQFDAQIQQLTCAFEDRLGGLANTVATREARANASARALKEAMEGGRNDEGFRMLQAENERQRLTILALQDELAREREGDRRSIGWDRERYFSRLGNDLGDIGRDVQEAGERLAGSDCPLARAYAAKLEDWGLDIGDFAQNAQAYADEAREQRGETLSAAAGD